MRVYTFLFAAGLVIMSSGLTVNGNGDKVTTETVVSSFPGLASGILSYARLGQLPDSLLVRGGTVEITVNELQQIIADGGALYTQQVLQNHAFFICEQRAAEEFLFPEAYARLKHSIRDGSNPGKQELISRYFITLAENEEVGEKELQDFYRSNRDVFGASTYVEVRDYIRKHLLDEKRQMKITRYIRTFGKRNEIVVSASWAAQQAEIAKQNPIDSARVRGKPSFVVFSSTGCCGPDRIMPVIDSVRTKYKDRLSVVYLDARQDPVLTARFNIYSIPAMIFYNKQGKEVSRLSSFRNTKDIEQQLIRSGLQ